MEYLATSRFLRVAPRKAQLVVDLVRGRSLNEAYDLLRLSKKKTAVWVRKLLDSAQHNAVDRNPKVDPDALFVRTITVGRGPVLKRFTAKAKGRGEPILKRMSHIRVILAEREAPAGRRRARGKAKAERAQQRTEGAPQAGAAPAGTP